MIIVITGLPGAGKTTTINEVLKRLDGKIEIISFGTEMMKIVQDRYGIQHRDEIRKKLTPQQIEEVQIEVAKRIHEYANSTSKLILVDTHAAIKTEFGYIPGIHDGMLRNMKISAFVYITTKYEEIMLRRVRDATRYRDEEDKVEISLHNEMNLAVLSSCSIQTGAPVKIIVNRDGELEKAVNELENYILKWMEQK
ncbi:MAG: adenylate kinase [Candidatus Micrarchaeota archaeon]|nr:adenylate kinase [Candidatus Micrarchaeota archaeon]MCX8154678.1 adenylate kinase [Candidatus Micrarchaeota archaeon]